MQVADLLSIKGHQIYSVSLSATIKEVVAELGRTNVGALIVMDDTTLVGIVSERDVIRNIAANDSSDLGNKVESIMTTELVTCTPLSTINEVMSLMNESRIRHLPVIDNSEIVGVISIGDVVKNIISEIQSEAEMLKGYISGSESA